MSTRARGRRSAWIVLAASVAVVIAVTAGRVFDRPDNVGSRSPQRVPSVPSVGTSVPSAQPIPTTRRPVRVQVARLDVRASVQPVGVGADGAMVIPKDARRVGWYRFGPAPGHLEGSAVLAGHVDSRTQGQGVFFRLAAIEVGDVILLTQAGGAKLTYRVVARESLEKERLPTEELFARDGPPRLTLITCSGAYIPSLGGYQSNLVVTATPDRPST